MKTPKTWVIVCNGDIARVFAFTARGKPIAALDDEVWHAPEVNEAADMPGMTHSSTGPSQHRMAPHTGPDKGLEAFAVDIADRLAKALKAARFERLIVVSAPRLLGRLRERLDDAVRASIWVEIDRDLTRVPVEQIERALEDRLFPVS